jgi:hypothetical protein
MQEQALTYVTRAVETPTLQEEASQQQEHRDPIDGAQSRSPAKSTQDQAVLLQNFVAAMRTKSPSLQAVLRSGFLLSVDDGELTIGFQFPFHANVWTDPGKRRLLEECVAEVMGSSYRVQCVRATRDEVTSTLGSSAIPEDDGFMEEAAVRLRQWHARQLGNGSS